MKNSRSLELCHAWSKQQKHDYNVKYYKENKDKWLEYARLDNARRRGELGDNKTNEDRAWNRYNDAYDEWDKSTARRSEISNQLIRGDAYKNPNARAALEKELAKARKQTEGNARKVNATLGDWERYRHLGGERGARGHGAPWTQEERSHMAPSVSVKSGSAGNPIVNKAKRAVKNATSSYTSAYKAGASTIAKAGKDFVKTWMSGWR